MSSQQSAPDSHVDLDLLALRYVTGELSVDDADTFEARLAEDQEARESVALAVGIGMAVTRQPVLAVVGATSSTPVEATASARFGWRWLAAAVLVIGVGLAVYLNRDMANREQLADETAQDLIVKWADNHDLSVASDLVAENQVDALFGASAGSFDYDDSLDFGAETPSWMVVVLAK